MILRIMLLSLFLSSCNPYLLKKTKQNKMASRLFENSDADFISYIAEYEEHAEKHTNNKNYKVDDIPINYFELENPKWLAACVTYPDGTKEVLVSEKWRDNTCESQRKNAIFHELGHCDLNRMHDNTMITVNSLKVPASIMHESVNMRTCDNSNLDVYMKELFTNSKTHVIDHYKAKQKI